MPEPLAGRLNLATLNTRGLPIRDSPLADRYTAIGAEFEAGPADVVCSRRFSATGTCGC